MIRAPALDRPVSISIAYSKFALFPSHEKSESRATEKMGFARPSVHEEETEIDHT